ncbi:MAG: DUF1573 domain-containing protein [Bacteroidota bacterium]
MKKLFLSIAIALVGTFAANAQTQPELNVNDNPNAPEISFVNLVHDYGKIENGADGNCEFKFTNTGKEPLRLTNVRSSCGCTVPKWTTDPILPGKTGVIQVKYDTKRTGVINKQITVTSNAKTATVVLSIKGEIMPAPVNAAPVKPEEGATPKAQ